MVDRAGTVHGPGGWPASRTYRAGEQEGLLIADNRTDDWDRATPAERERLARRAWGRPA